MQDFDNFVVRMGLAECEGIIAQDLVQEILLICVVVELHTFHHVASNVLHADREQLAAHHLQPPLLHAVLIHGCRAGLPLAAEGQEV